MDIFNITSAVVVFALLVSLLYWFQIWKKGTDADFKKGSSLYVVCFALYVFGQTLVILQSNNVVNGWYDLPSYCYALAALLFAVGSYYQHKSIARRA